MQLDRQLTDQVHGRLACPRLQELQLQIEDQKKAAPAGKFGLAQ
jgi:hypothetical protein